MLYVQIPTGALGEVLMTDTSRQYDVAASTAHRRQGTDGSVDHPSGAHPPARSAQILWGRQEVLGPASQIFDRAVKIAETLLLSTIASTLSVSSLISDLRARYAVPLGSRVTTPSRASHTRARAARAGGDAMSDAAFTSAIVAVLASLIMLLCS
jgi:hypothetical protein